MPYGDKKSYGFFKMKYQGSPSAFPFKSPLRDERKPLKADLETEGDMPERKAFSKTKGDIKKFSKTIGSKMAMKTGLAEGMSERMGSIIIKGETKMKPPYKKPVGPRAK